MFGRFWTTGIVAAVIALGLWLPQAVAAAAPQTVTTEAAGLPNLDRRIATPAPIPAAVRSARRELSDDLGPLAEVRTDQPSGGVAYIGRPDELLTGPSDEAPEEIVLDYVRANQDVFGLGRDDFANLKLVSRIVSPDGIIHLRFNQVLNGIESFDSGITGHVTGDGRLINVSGAPVPGARLPETDPVLGVTAGLAAARRGVRRSGLVPEIEKSGSGPWRSTIFDSGERIRLRWTVTADGPTLAWHSITFGEDGHGYDVLVNAEDGELLRRQDLTQDLGEIHYFPYNPLGGQGPFGLPEAPARITMPPEWYDQHDGGTRLWGQYARTYTDPQNEDPDAGDEDGGNRVQIAASGGSPDSPDWLHTQKAGSIFFPDCPGLAASFCTWDGGDESNRDSAEANQLQAGANAHVLVSRFHDHLERAPIGFDEASGNFQRVNTSGQGLGGDYVRVEVNDGSGTNNASMFTPPDGQAPRMQMFLWTSRAVNGSDDASVVYHEYTHGLSHRLVVNASGSSTLLPLQSRMMGEGWSDFYALDLLEYEGRVVDTPASAEVRLGEYVRGPGGVRSKPIDCPVAETGVDGCNGHNGDGAVLGGYTYGDLSVTRNNTPHNGGEVWAQTLWEIRSHPEIGREAALALITGGMRLSPESPSMLDMRDAILQQAVATRSAIGADDDYYAALWEIFSSRGMGASASAPSPDATKEVSEAFDLPSEFRVAETVFRDPYPGGDNDGIIEPGEIVFVDQPIWNWGLTELPGLRGTMSLLSGDPDLTVLDASATWPTIGVGHRSVNETPMTLRMPIGKCTETSTLSIAMSSPQGETTVEARVDPRPGDNSEVPLIDAKSEGEGISEGVTYATFTVASSGTIADVNLRIDELRHYWLGDIKVELIHPDGTIAQIFDYPIADDGDPDFGWYGKDIVDAIFDSDGGEPLVPTGLGPLTGHLRTDPPDALDAFVGLPAAGTWKLRITDRAPGQTGTLKRWGLDSDAIDCPRAEIPEASTGEATDIGRHSAVLGGSVTPNGRATGLRFVYGTSEEYGKATPVVDVGDGDEPVAHTATITDLAPSTTYHYRVESIRENGQVAVVGEDRTFTTAAIPVDPGPDLGPVSPPAPGTDRGDGRPGGTAPPRFVGKPRVVLRRVSPRSVRRRATLRFRISRPARVRANVFRLVRGTRRGIRCVTIPTPGVTRSALRDRRPRSDLRRRCFRRAHVIRVIKPRAGRGPVTLPLGKRAFGRGLYAVSLAAAVPGSGRPRTAMIRFRVPPPRGDGAPHDMDAP